MCTRGRRLVRFSGRYYRFYNDEKWNSSPDNYGSDIVNEIPIDPDKYQKWLAEQRAKASEWASALDKVPARETPCHQRNERSGNR